MRKVYYVHWKQLETIKNANEMGAETSQMCKCMWFYRSGTPAATMKPSWTSWSWRTSLRSWRPSKTRCWRSCSTSAPWTLPEMVSLHFYYIERQTQTHLLVGRHEAHVLSISFLSSRHQCYQEPDQQSSVCEEGVWDQDPETTVWQGENLQHGLLMLTLEY